MDLPVPDVGISLILLPDGIVQHVTQQLWQETFKTP
jgi:hypothetical protein